MRFGLRMPNSEELRVARDGGAYTWKEFQKHYSKKVALKRWQEASPVANSASQPAEEVRCASDALAVVEKLVEKPSDARSCGDAFAPPQGRRRMWRSLRMPAVLATPLRHRRVARRRLWRSLRMPAVHFRR